MTTVYTFGVEQECCNNCGHNLSDPQSVIVDDILTNIGEEGNFFYQKMLDPNQNGELVLSDPTPKIICATCQKEIEYTAYDEPG